MKSAKPSQENINKSVKLIPDNHVTGVYYPIRGGSGLPTVSMNYTKYIQLHKLQTKFICDRQLCTSTEGQTSVLDY